MTTAQAVINEYLQSVKALSTEMDFYDFEKQFVTLHEELGRKVLEIRLSERQGKQVYKKKFKAGTAPLK